MTQVGMCQELHGITHSFTPRGNTFSPVHLLACIWEGGGKWRTQRKPEIPYKPQNQEEFKRDTGTTTRLAKNAVY